MKRSKIINLIHEELVFSRTPMQGVRVTNSPADLELATRILTIVEKAGMLPPISGDQSGNNKIWELEWESEE